MIYHCLTLDNLTTDQGTKVSKKVLFAFEHNKEVLTYKDLISNQNLLVHANVEGFMRLAKTPEYPAMLITVNGADEDRLIDWDSLLAQLKQQKAAGKDLYAPAAVEAFVGFILKCLEPFYTNLGGTDTETITKLYYACINAESTFADKTNSAKVNNFELIDSNFRNFTMEKSETTVEKWTVPTLQTLKQVQCTDKLSLTLPPIVQVHALINGGAFNALYTVLPKRGDVSSPYTSLGPAADSADYKEINSGITSDKYYLIEGKVENNTLGIQENEKEFYDYLNQWILTSVRFANGNEKLGEDGDYESVIIDKTTESFLELLLEYFYAWYWRHNQLMTDAGDPVDDDDDDDDESTGLQAVMSSYDFINKFDENDDTQGIAPAYILLCNYAKTVCKKKGFTIYSELIVKLLRWGDRKPTAINFEGYPELFELGTCKVHSYIGNVEDYEIAFDADGYSRQIMCWLATNEQICDTEYTAKLGAQGFQIACPIGAKIGTLYINKKTNEQIVISKYYAITDLVESIMTTDKFVKGIKYENNRIIADEQLLEKVEMTNFSMEEAIQSYEANKATQLVNPFYVSDAIKSLKLEMGVNETAEKFNTLSVISDVMQTPDLEEHFSSVIGKSHDEIMEAINNFELNSVIEAATYKKGYEIYPVLIRVNKLFQEGTFKTYTEMLNAFKPETAQTAQAIESTTAPVSASTSQSAPAMMAFGGASESDSAPAQPVQPVQPTQPLVQEPAQPVQPIQELVQEPAQPLAQEPAQPLAQEPTQPVQTPVQEPTQPLVQEPTQSVSTENPQVQINNPEAMNTWFKQMVETAFISESKNLQGSKGRLIAVNRNCKDENDQIVSKTVPAFVVVEDADNHLVLYNVEKRQELLDAGMQFVQTTAGKTLVIEPSSLCKYICANIGKLLTTGCQSKMQFTFASKEVLARLIRLT